MKQKTQKHISRNKGSKNGMWKGQAKRCSSCANKGKNNPFYGKSHTEKTKKKMREFYDK